jgi:(2Fe-2S) ferredoxin
MHGEGLGSANSIAMGDVLLARLKLQQALKATVAARLGAASSPDVPAKQTPLTGGTGHTPFIALEVCGAADCWSLGGGAAFIEIEELVAEMDPESIQVKRSQCHGLCGSGPVVAVVRKRPSMHTKVENTQVFDKVQAHVAPAAFDPLFCPSVSTYASSHSFSNPASFSICLCLS